MRLVTLWRGKQFSKGLYRVTVHGKYIGALTFLRISRRVSCTEALKAPSSSLLFGVRNTTFGLGFYLVLLACVLLHAVSAAYFPVWILFVLSFCGAIASLYLLQLSLVVLQIACPLCMGLHLVNFSLLWLSWKFSEEVRW